VFTSQLLPTELMGRIAPSIKPQTGDQAARKAHKRKEASERTDTATNALEEGLTRGGLGAFAGLAKRASKQVENPGDAQQKKDLEPLEEFGANQASVLYLQIDRPGAAAPAQVVAGRHGCAIRNPRWRYRDDPEPMCPAWIREKWWPRTCLARSAECGTVPR
jgi:hypothetical protein